MTREEILKVAKPILFNTEMVRAILDGRKTETRRAVKFPPGLTGSHAVGKAGKKDNMLGIMWACGIKRPPYKPGDYLYVRETWNGLPADRICPAEFWYKADEEILNPDDKWRPSINMPKEAARIFLRVTDRKIEHLQDITEEGALAEGAINTFGFIRSPENEYAEPPHTAKKDFEKIWDSTIKPKDRDKYGWQANPWVWVYKFERVEVDE